MFWYVRTYRWTDGRKGGRMCVRGEVQIHECEEGRVDRRKERWLDVRVRRSLSTRM